MPPHASEARSKRSSIKGTSKIALLRRTPAPDCPHVRAAGNNEFLIEGGN